MKPVDSVTEQMIRNCLRYEPETGKIYWTDHWTKNQLVGTEATSQLQRCYLRVKINGQTFRQHNVAWFLYFGEWPDDVLDHIDGNKTNNRISNLRSTDKYGNARNKASASGTGYKGVSKRKNGRYSSTITPQGTYTHLGTFDTAMEAAKAYDAAAIEHFGEFARLNFPEEINT